MNAKFRRKSVSFFDRFFAYLDERLPGDKLVIYILLFIFVGSGLYSLMVLSKSKTTSVPESGGTLVEGVIGTPRFVNPVLAINRADHDLVALTYSGLMKIDETGTLVPDLAESVTLSDDGLVYNIVLRTDATFHDGTPLTAEDVSFTIASIQNPELKSPLQGNWGGVSVEVLGEHELNLVLDMSYSPFIENLTVGILPKHIWSELTTEEFPFSQHNTEPIGSGPYQVTDTGIERGPSGLVSAYTLRSYQSNSDDPLIESIKIRFYNNEEAVLEALKNKQITATAALGESMMPAVDADLYHIIERPLPRVFAVYFNQNRSPALREQTVREALAVMVDRNALIDAALSGYGSPATGPLPAGFGGQTGVGSTTEEFSSEERLSEAQQILFDGGWTRNEDGAWDKEIDEAETRLAITIRTANSDVFEKTANYLEETWSELGVEVGVELYEQSDLVQAVIRPRDYQALLFGAEVGRALDLYPFWHSSEREDPGLNISLYTNITTDKYLSDLRTTPGGEERTTLLEDFNTEVTSEVPAIFLYSPSFTYVVGEGVTLPDMNGLNRASDRFSNISEWYIDESQVWPIFEN